MLEMTELGYFPDKEYYESNRSGLDFPLMEQDYGNHSGNGTSLMFVFSDNIFTSIIAVMDTYVMPVIIVIGVLGNTCCIVVHVSTPQLWRQSSSIYLVFFSAVNNGFLITLFIVWFSWVGIHVFHKTGWCQMTQYIKDVCYFLSAWTVVSFTVERWIVVFYPLKRHQLCTRRRATVVMVALTSFALVFYSLTIFMTSVHRWGEVEVCSTDYPHGSLLLLFKSVDVVMVVMVPLVVIIVMNLAIGIKIWHYTHSSQSIPYHTGCDHSKVRVSLVKSRAAAAAGETVDLSSRPATRLNETNSSRYKQTMALWRKTDGRQQTQLRTTRALMVVSTVFVMMTLPSSVMKTQYFVLTVRGRDFLPALDTVVWLNIIELLNYMNFSSSFFLLSACSRNFRQALSKMLRRACRKLHNMASRRCQKARGLLAPDKLDEFE